MCFSAEVSFGASAIISTVGIMSIKKSTTKEQLLFAMVPILFGIQQFFEAWLWIALTSGTFPMLETVSTFGFLIFAQLIWPIWVPLSAYTIEPNQLRKRLIGFTLVLGLILFGILAYRMAIYDVKAQIDHFHIYYTVGHFQSTNWWSGIFYLLPAVFPFLLSSKKEINYLGLAMLGLFIISKVFYLKYMISVWCLFAAILSVYIFFILKKEEKQLTIDDLSPAQ